MGEIIAQGVLAAVLCVTVYVVTMRRRDAEARGVASEHAREVDSLKRRIESLELRLCLQRRPGTTSDMVVGFHGVFLRRSSVVELDFGSLVVVYQGDSIDEAELEDWTRQYVSAAAIAQFCTTSELQSWLEKR